MLILLHQYANALLDLVQSELLLVLTCMTPSISKVNIFRVSKFLLIV
jgi:hypothetical protein